MPSDVGRRFCNAKVMEQLSQFFIEWGYAGIFVSAFLAGSVVPFASEAVVVVLVQTGLAPVPCIVWATVGNTLGGITCYMIGRAGKPEWASRWLGIKPPQMERAMRFLKGHGAWMALFVALPYIGDAIAVALGYMRANFTITTLSMLIGKCLRYIAVVYAAEGILSLF